MPALKEIQIKCSSCGKVFSATACNYVNVADTPEMKERVRSGELFLNTCPYCGRPSLGVGPFLYSSPDERLVILLSEAPVDDSGLAEGYTARRVSSVGELIEKIKIFDDGLDDRVIELCKYVTSQDLGRDVAMKYLKMDGADGEITFTYPDDGKMEMVAVGFSVYENCRAIVQRNPVFDERSQGLCRIDSGFISDILE